MGEPVAQHPAAGAAVDYYCADYLLMLLLLKKFHNFGIDFGFDDIEVY